MVSPIITLTTDFGNVDPYVGVMKGVILGINPRASVVDISHEVSPQSVHQGAYVIGSSHGYFPEGTIHVVVVDPGVGTSRNALLVISPRASFLAPDNGVLSYVLGDGFQEQPEGAQVPVPAGHRAYRLTREQFWLHPVSSTFHGRDIFAPVAAHLSLGLPPEQMGEEVSHLVCLPKRSPRWEGGSLVGEVVHADRFGNLITNIPAYQLQDKGAVTFELKGHRIRGISSSYAEGGGLLAIVGSNDTVEVSVKNGSAAEELEAGVGDPVRVCPTTGCP